MIDSIDSARAALLAADALLITAGAGMSADSGLPTFRGREGLWQAYPGLKRLNMDFTDIANPRAFRLHPDEAWRFYGHRLNLYRENEPHAGYRHLLDLARGKGGGSFVFTSNVDGHFQRAGFNEASIVEIHGSIHRLQCTGPCGADLWAAPEVNEGMLPACPQCGGLARPNILMFNDPHWIADITQARLVALQDWLKKLELDGTRLAVIEIGAGLAIPTVRLFSEEVARRFDAPLIRINPDAPESVYAKAIRLPMGGKAALDVMFRGQEAVLPSPL
ncbi:MAG: NAD-dependent deacetylase [Gammaproteobacteria bacterium]|nr:NAD-dependent deacetylase [Gammaproteobacteria bacterium]MBU1654498.1 NAD-dependent deacetylase [Gammaproteobacteria bacterium]MBU1960685.1 NAD-dependent deacetylase [Gammaproteobacteria bacterium]